MKTDVRDIFKVAGILTLICVVSASLLAVTNMVTKDYIKKNSEKKINKALFEVINGGTVTIKDEISPMLFKIEKRGKKGDRNLNLSKPFPVKNSNTVLAYYKVSEDGELVGYILDIVGKGYGGDLKILCYYDILGNVLEAVLVSNSETPGIGKKAEEAGYMDKFKFSDNNKTIPQDKKDLPKNQVDSIAGATVTFKGVAKTLLSGSEFIKKGDIR